MKTIKDILKADNYEQRRRIANNLAISREDKNALIVNQSSGWGGDSNLIYYKPKPNVEGTDFEEFLPMFANRLNYIFQFSDEKLNHYVGSGGLIINSCGASYIKILAIGVPSNIKMIHNDGWNPDALYEGPFVPTFTSILKGIFGEEININDYLEPITEEEFYNIKPE